MHWSRVGTILHCQRKARKVRCQKRGLKATCQKMELKVKCQKMVLKVRKLVLRETRGRYLRPAVQSSYNCHLPGAPTWLCHYDLVSNNVPMVDGESEKKTKRINRCVERWIRHTELCLAVSSDESITHLMRVILNRVGQNGVGHM